jgi:hypothetical protein
MNEPIQLRRVGVLSPFDEARAEIARWEKEYPDTLYFAMVVNTPRGFEYTVTGENTVSEAAGIFFRAAQLAAE